MTRAPSACGWYRLFIRILLGASFGCTQAPRAAVTSSLVLPWNRMQDAGIVALARVLATYSPLTTLDLRGNQMQADGACAVASAMVHHPGLTRLRLSFGESASDLLPSPARANSAAASALADLLRTNTTLTDLDWSGPGSPDDAHRVSSALRLNARLVIGISVNFRIVVGDTLVRDESHASPHGDRAALRLLFPSEETASVSPVSETTHCGIM
jgi:hypothetical protein